MMVTVMQLEEMPGAEGIYLWPQRKWENICQSGKK